MEETQLSGHSRRLLGLISIDNGEKVVYEIRKHVFGLILIYLIGLFITAVLVVTFFGGVWFLDGTGQDLLGDYIRVGSFRTPTLIVGSVLILLSLLATFIGAFLYQSNVVLVTTDKITQILYRSLFDRKISQLSIGDIQDVTVDQRGLIARLLDFGTLIIETAGEQQNYTFTYVPKPYEASKAIMDAHEANLKKYGN